MEQDPLQGIHSINTGGGALVLGNVDTGGGDFIGGDKIVQLPKPEPPFFWGLPSRPAHFVGRRPLVEQLAAALLDKSGAPVVLEGLPGAGKSSLALALANDPAVRAHFKDGVLWASLGKNPPIVNIMSGWMGALGEPTGPDGISNPERSQMIRNLIGDISILLVIDDAWHEETAALLRCDGRNSRILLTTRDKGLAHRFTTTPRVFTVPELSSADAEKLLSQVAPQAFAADPDLARSLIRSVGGLPLGLTVLGGYLQAPERSFFADLSQAALTELEDPALRLTQVASRISAPASGPETLAQILALSLDGLPPEAISAFHALGAFAPKPAYFTRAAAEQVTAAPAQILGLLGMRNLIEQMEGGALTVHQVLADMARTETSPAAIQRHRDYYLAQVREDVQDWRRIEFIYDQIRVAWQTNPDDPSLFPFLSALRTYHRRRGLWQDELEWSARALKMAEAENLTLETATMHYIIGQIQNRLGSTDSALGHIRRAQSIVEETGDTHGQVQAEQMLGIIYLGTNRSERCFAHFENALRLAEQLDDQQIIAESLLTLAHACRRHDRHQEALELVNRILPMERALENRTGEADALSIQSMALAGLDRHDEALGRLHEAAAIWQALDNPAELADLYNGIARVYKESGRYDEALKVVKSALPFWESIGDRAGYADSLTRMGDIQLKTGDARAALETYQDALAERIEIGAQLKIADTHQDVAIAWHKIGNYAASLEAQQSAFNVWEAMGRLDRLADGYLLMGSLFGNAGLPASELPFAQQGLVIWWKLGAKAETALALAQVGRTYLHMDLPNLAVLLFKKEIQLRQEVDDPGAEARAHFYAGLAYEDLDQPEAALPHWQVARDIWEAKGDQPNRAMAWQRLAENYSKQGKTQQAIEAYQQLIEYQKAFEDPDELAFSHYFLSTELEQDRKPEKALTHLQRALALWKDTENRAMQAVAHRELGRLLNLLGNPADSLEQYHQALSQYQRLEDQAGQAVILRRLAHLQNALGDSEKAIAHLVEKAALFVAMGDRTGEAETLTEIGALYEQQQQYGAAVAHYGKAAAALDNSDSPLQLADIYHKRGSALFLAKRPEESLETLQTALTIWTAHREALAQAHTLSALGVVLKSTGRWSEAFQKFKEAVQLFEAAGDRFWLANTFIWMGLNQSELGRFEAAIDYLEQALAIFQELNQPEWQANAAVNLATALDRTGDQARSQKYAQLAAGFLAQDRPEVLDASQNYDIGQVNLLLGQYLKAVDHFSQALTLFEAAAELEGKAMTHRRYGVTLFRDGRGEEGISHLKLAVQLHAELGKPWLEAHVRLDLARILRAEGQLEAAREEYKRILTLVDDPDNRTVRDAMDALQKLEEK